MRDVNSPTLLAGSLAGLVLLAVAGCAPGEEFVGGESEEDASSAIAVRRVLLCQQGLSDRTSGWDKGLFEVCEGAEDAGFEVVWDGEYPAFGALSQGAAYKALFKKLDTNGDGWVDGKDVYSEIYLVGFSWGGINTSDVAEGIRTDWRIASSRSFISGMVLFDAFQPQISRVNIPSNVFDAWVYRQTETTEGDCSASVSFGWGFNGHRPKAKSEMTFCSMYDLDEFLGEVGHCDVPTVARDAALHNLKTRTDYEPWAAHAEDCPTK